MDKIPKGKQRIIEATREILKENPIEDVTMRKIAKKAGVTTGALYHHYKNKDELCFDVMKNSLLFTHRLSDTINQEETKKQGKELLDVINAEVATRLSKSDEQKLYIQFFGDMIKRKSEIYKEFRENYQDMINNTANLFVKAFEIDNEEYKKSVASILVAAMDGIAMQQALDILPEDLEKIIKVYISFFNESIPAYLEKHLKSKQ
jgi:AcrR family transcriptional regulator